MFQGWSCATCGRSVLLLFVNALSCSAGGGWISPRFAPRETPAVTGGVLYMAGLSGLMYGPFGTHGISPQAPTGFWVPKYWFTMVYVGFGQVLVFQPRALRVSQQYPDSKE